MGSREVNVAFCGSVQRVPIPKTVNELHRSVCSAFQVTAPMNLKTASGRRLEYGDDLVDNLDNAEGLVAEATDAAFLDLERQKDNITHMQWRLLREQLSAMRTETAELRCEVASVRQDQSQLAGRLENETSARAAQATKLEGALAAEVKVLEAGVRNVQNADLVRAAKLEDTIAELDKRMQSMVEDVRIEGNAAMEAAVCAEKSAREEADASLEKRLRAVAADLDTQTKEQAARSAEVSAALDEIGTRLDGHDGRIAPAESAIRALEQAATALRADLATAAGKSAADLSALDKRLSAAFSAEAAARTTEAAGLAEGLAAARSAADAEAKARARSLAKTVKALDATVSTNEARTTASIASVRAAAEEAAAENRQSLAKLSDDLLEKLTDQLQHEKQARQNLDMALREWTGGLVRSAAEEEGALRSDGDQQEIEARLRMSKDLRTWTEDIVVAAVDEERKARTDAGKTQSYLWNTALAELAVALRSEAKAQEGAAAAGREELGASLEQVRATVASLEQDFESHSTTATTFADEVRETLGDLKERTTGTEDALQTKADKPKTSTYVPPRTMSIPALTQSVGALPTFASYGAGGPNPMTPRTATQRGYGGQPVKAPSTPSTISSTPIVSPRTITPRNPSNPFGKSSPTFAKPNSAGAA